MSDTDNPSTIQRIGMKISMMFDNVREAFGWLTCTHKPWLEVTPLEMLGSEEGAQRLLKLLDEYFDSHPEIEERYREKQSSTGDGD